MIDSVSNYCHRWCERCPFTSRCGPVVFTKNIFYVMTRKSSLPSQMNFLPSVGSSALFWGAWSLVC
jgi:hypothetical protein